MDEIDLKEFFKYLKRYLWLYVVILTAAISATYFYETNLKTPLYQSTAKVVLVQPEQDTNASSTLNGVNASQKLTQTYSEIAKSDLVLDQVIANLHLDTTPKELTKSLTVNPVEDTSILSISVKDRNPDQAAAIANQIAQVFNREIAQIYKLDNVSLLDEAKSNQTVVNNTTTRDLIIAAALSLFGVTALAFLIFYLDDTVKHTQDLERDFKTPLAGKIVDGSTKHSKHAKRKRNSVDQIISQELVVEDQPKSVVSESIKNLRTNLQFTSVDQGLKTIVLTSSNPSEGKSYIAANLAISFVQADKRVLLVDCDLRKGRLHQIFRLQNVKGYSNLLAGEINQYYNYIQKTNIKNLDLLTRGTCPPNPSELLSSKKNATLIERLKSNYDIIIFDGTPVTGLADSVVVSTLVDETLIVARDSFTTRAALQETKAALDKVDARIAGVVLNRVDRKGGKYYYYYGEKK